MEFVLIWFLFGIISSVAASNKGRSGCGWFLVGVLLGPFGFILALIVNKDQSAIESEAIRSGGMKKCIYCAELIKFEAIVCRFCGKELAPVEIINNPTESFECYTPIERDATSIKLDNQPIDYKYEYNTKKIMITVVAIASLILTYMVLSQYFPRTL